ncbi:hypothetical protein CPC08DRAFT_768423 [Agrocybe pediades]|nr:hypothetical protein CPC08DRAFT_768423 [Agrocybe pediades]
MRLAPLLTSYELYDVDETAPIVNVSPHFVHPKLEYIHYEVLPGAEAVHDIFSFNAFPGLKRLQYSTLKFWDPLVDHMERYSPPLEELNIGFSRCYPENLSSHGAQAPIPSERSSFPPPTMDNLNERKEYFLPQLEVLYFNFLFDFPWHLVPHYFGSPRDRHRRPPVRFEVVVDEEAIVDEKYSIIPKEALLRLVEMREMRYDIKYETIDQRDLFEESLKFHNIC